MATTNILGLFTSPEDYQAQQAANDQQRAVAFSSMDPRQLANYSLFMGGQQLGRGLAGVFGVQDPQLQRIRQRQEIMQTINPADPDSLMAGIQRASQAGDQELALTLADYTRKAGGDLALAQQRLAAAGRERQQAIPADIAKARELGVLTTALNALEQTPETPERNQQIAMLRTQISALDRPEKVTPDMANAAALADLISTDRDSDAWKQEYKLQFTRLTTKPENEKRSAYAQELIDAGYIPGSPMYVSMMDRYLEQKLTPKQEKELSFGVDREATAMSEFGKRFSELTQDQQKKVNKMVDEERGRVSEKGATKLVLPGEEKPVDIPKVRKELKESLRPYGEVIDAGDVGIALMNDAINTGNFASFESARTNLAKMVDPGRLTNADIERAGVDPAVVSRARDLISRVFTSTPSKQTMENMLSTMKLMRKVARAKYDRELETQRKLARQSKIPDQSIETLFEDVRRPEKKPASSSKAVDFNTLPK